MPTTTYTDSTFGASAIGNRTDPAGLAVADYTAEEARFLLQLLTPGYLKPLASFRVQAQAVPGMGVTVGSGTAKADYYVIAGDVGGQGNYMVRLDTASLAVPVPAADASQVRTDEIYLVVRDDVYDASARALPQIGYRKGDLGGVNPGADPAWRASALLARITVAAAATSITSGNITDQRSVATVLAAPSHGALTGLLADDHPQYLLKTLADVKGDLLAATAADTFARVAVGTNGQFLTANSAAPAGLEWAPGVTTASTLGSAVVTATTDVNIVQTTVTVGPTGRLLVLANVNHFKSVNDANVDVALVSLALSGASTASSADVSVATVSGSMRRYKATSHELFTGLTPGSTTVTAKGRIETAGDSVNVAVVLTAVAL